MHDSKTMPDLRKTCLRRSSRLLKTSTLQVILGGAAVHRSDSYRVSFLALPPLRLRSSAQRPFSNSLLDRTRSGFLINIPGPAACEAGLGTHNLFCPARLPDAHRLLTTTGRQRQSACFSSPRVVQLQFG